MSIVSYTSPPKLSWFLALKKSLIKYRASRISLCLKLRPYSIGKCSDHDSGVEAMPRPVAVLEDLRIIDEPPTSLCYCLMRRLFRICRPKFVTFALCPTGKKKCRFPFDELCERVMHQVMTLDRDLLGQLGLKKVTNSEKVIEGGFQDNPVTIIRFELV